MDGTRRRGLRRDAIHQPLNGDIGLVIGRLDLGGRYRLPSRSSKPWPFILRRSYRSWGRVYASEVSAKAAWMAS